MSLTPEQKLQSFFYELLRDHVGAHVVEDILQSDEHAFQDATEVTYSNPYLANYATDIARRLLGEGESEIKNRIVDRRKINPMCDYKGPDK
jgi:hypothetical protein